MKENLTEFDIIPMAEITNTGIRYTDHKFTSREKMKTKEGEKEVEVLRKFEREWLFDDNVDHYYFSYIGSDRFSAIAFQRDQKKLKILAERLQTFLLTKIILDKI